MYVTLCFIDPTFKIEINRNQHFATELGVVILECAQGWQSLGPCWVYTHILIRQTDPGLGTSSGPIRIAKIGFILTSVRSRGNFRVELLFPTGIYIGYPRFTRL